MSDWKDSEIGRIPSKWTVGTLEDVSQYITDGAHISPKFVKSDYYMASVKDMRYNYFDFTECKTISKEDFETLEKGKCSPEYGDILLSKDGANCLDLIFVYKQKDRIVLLSSIAIARLKKECNSDFYRYYLLSPNIQEIMRNNYVSGSAIPRVILTDFKNVPVPILPEIEQKAISSILSSLDEKIDLLQSQNITLEKLAETLFRNWFIEEVKDEWAISSLSEMANFLNGLACQKFPPINEIDKLPVLKIKELSSGITENSDWASTDIKSEYIVKNGDVIFAWSASLMVKIWNGQDCILNQHLFKVTSEDYPKWFYYLWCKHHLAEFISIAASHATTMGHIKRGDLDEAKVLIPSPKELAEMTEQAEPLIQKIIANNIQINTLIKLRDSLLPKLMSGEVTVELVNN